MAPLTKNATGKMLKLTQQQEQSLSKWLKRDITRRCKPKELLVKMGLEEHHLRTLYRIISERKTRSGTRNLHVSDEEIVKKCKQMRKGTASTPGSAKITQSQVAGKMREDRGKGKTFLSPARVQKALKKAGQTPSARK